MRKLGLLRLSVILAIVALFAPVLVANVAAQETVRCGAFVATIVGTPGDDVINGTNGRDVIVGLGGHDRINGMGGHDVICGGAGRDRLFGGRGRDYLNGGAGRDRLVGNAGNDRLIGASGSDTLRGGSGRDRVKGGGGSDICEADAVFDCERVLGAPAAPANNPEVDLVVHISIDGLRSDHVTPRLTPNLTELMERGTSTLNARTDSARTQTLPNHLSQFTGRPVLGPDGHQVNFNEDNDRTVHNQASKYVSSVFDVVHDAGGRTAVYVGKPKFDFVDRSWNGMNGARDFVGDDNGRDKIDVYNRADPDVNLGEFRTDLQDMGALQYAFFHIRYPDSAGHESGWASAAYVDAVERSDRMLGDLLGLIDASPRSIAVVVTSDHGGPTNEFFHNEETERHNFVVPMVVHTPGQTTAADLYALNAGRRVDPGIDQLPETGPQPIRGHEVANLTLDLLGLDPVPGSVSNVDQDLLIR